uniref:carbohydrate ABC transporter permease n=1 Tax=Vaginimicrobium propionicum TaxID=1871034 RepID=UPI0009709EB5|nr:sugar ABC transporter permease [Vaginimicrobium propionicum]
MNFVNKHIKTTFIAPAIIYTALVLIFPLLYTVYVSFTAWSGSALNEPRWLGLGNYVAMFTTDPRFVPAIWRTLGFTVVTVFVEVFLGYLVALLLRKPFRGERLVRTVILLPVVATPVAIAMAWMLILDPNIGIMNIVFNQLGLPAQQFLADPKHALGWLILVDIWQWTPMMILILLAGLTALPEDPYEAAIVDGASAWQRFWHLTFPLMLPSMFSAIVLRLVDSLKTFDLIYSTTKGGPGTATETLNIYGFMQAFEYTNFGKSSAVIVVFIAIVLAVTLLTSKVQTQAERVLK